MSYQVITTDIAQASVYGTRVKPPKKTTTELLREEKARLFGSPVAEPMKRGPKPRENVKYELKRGTLKNYGRKCQAKEYKLPDYGRAWRWKKFILNTPEHNDAIDFIVNELTQDFANAFELEPEQLRSANKDYHITRVRNCLHGFLYAHFDINGDDLVRNFPYADKQQFRERYRQLKYLLQWVYFARPISKIYKKHKEVLHYEYRNGKQIVRHR
jgi:hypothetical protein